MRLAVVPLLLVVACGGGADHGVDAAPPVSCTFSPADVGVWRDITPAAFHDPSNMETWAVAVDPQAETVYAAAGNITNTCGGDGQPACTSTGIYASSDCGGSFTGVTTGRNAAAITSGDPWVLRIDHDDPKTMYLDSGYGSNPTLFRSTDGGVDWDPLAPDVSNVLSVDFVQAVAMDPHDSKHLVVTFHEDCMSKFNGNCLSETTDGGTTWRELSGPSELTGWAEAASITILDTKSFLLTTPAGTGGAFFTGDSGASWTQVITGPAYGSYGGGAIIAADGNAYLAVANTGVFVSTGSPLGATWTLIPGSPMGSVVMDDGQNLYVSWGFNKSTDAYWVAPLAGLTSASPPAFRNMTTPPAMTGANMFAWDAAHHVLYAAGVGSGLWRLVTQ